jgi:hypothetical protein
MDWSSVLSMPLRLFWNLNKQVSRLRAEEQLSQIEMFLIANDKSDLKMVERLQMALKERMGEPMVEDKTVVDKEQHATGLAKLKALRNRWREEGQLQ